MRSFFKYLVAAFLAAIVWIVPTTPQALSAARATFATNDPASIAGMISAGIVNVVMATAGIFLVIGGIWFSARLVLRKLRLKMNRIWNIPIAVLVFWMTTFAVMGLYLSDFGTSLALHQATVVATFTASILPGAAWGVVFWIRAPKADQKSELEETFA